MKKNIAVFTESLRSGGKERRLLELLKALANDPEYDVILFIFSEDVFYQYVYDLNIKVVKFRFKGFDALIGLLKLAVSLVRFKPHIVHSWNGMTSVVSLLFKPFLRFKLINGMITDAPVKMKRKRKWYAKISFLFSDIILSNSFAGLRAFGVLNKSNSKVIYNGLDMARFDGLPDVQSVRLKYGIPNGKMVVGMVASFTIKKDFESFLEAAQLILKNRDDVVFVCIGDGPLLVDHKARFAHSNILFLGNINEVEALVQVFDIGVLMSNSKVHGEGLSNSILEYMALGKPVIASNSGGTSELVIDEQNGYLIPPFQVEDLIDGIIRMLDSEDLRLKYGRKAYHHIQTKYQLSTMTGHFMKLYDSLI